jgi:hypothetical protein
MSIVGESQAMTGKVIGGCKLQALLGSGGMGAVYRGQHLSLQKNVAVKVMSSTLAGNTEYITRFISEARLAAQLEHPNIVQVLNVGCEGGHHFIVMQFVEGESLSDRIKKQGPFSPGEAMKITLAAAHGIAAAHKKGIVHRDIKPANILLSPDGTVKVADMGLAKIISTAEDSGQTQAGAVLGTPDYMPPEQAEDARSADARNDIYSLGCTLYHMLIGMPPFSGKSSWAIIQKHMNEPVTPPKKIRADIPQAVSDLVVRMMAKKREERPQSMAEVIAELERLSSEGGDRSAKRLQPVATAAAPRRQQAAAPSKKSLAWVWIAGGAVILLVIVAALLGKPSPAQQAYEGAHTLWEKNPKDYDTALNNFQKVAAEFPGTQWAEKANADAKTVREAREKAAYTGAHTFWEKNPNDFDGATAELQKVATQFSGSQWAEKANADLKAVLEARQKAADAEFTRRQSVAATAVQNQNYTAAFKTWDEFPAALLTGDVAEKVKVARFKARLPVRISEFWHALQKKDHEAALKYLDPVEVANAGREPTLTWLRIAHGFAGIVAELEGFEIKKMDFSEDAKQCNVIVLMKLYSKVEKKKVDADAPPAKWFVYKDDWYARTK